MNHGQSTPSGALDFPLDDEALAGAVLSVDLNAVVANWRIVQGLYGDAGEAGAVVKADAYGLGAVPVATALAAAGCRTFFVALPQEALRLRALLPREATVYALSSPAGAFAAFAAGAVRPVLSTPEQAETWLAHAADKPYAVQVETGMNRLGLSETQFAALQPRLSPTLLMSHLACEAEHPLTQQQLTRFQAYCRRMPATPASLAASSGILRGPEYRFDLGRPGLALYGGNPLPDQPNRFHPVLRLEAKIIQTREIDSSGWVGYGATYAVAPGTRLATVAAGYADGLPRVLSNRGVGRIQGIRVPFVGRVSMDMICFDVSAVPPDLARPGRTITVLDSERTIDVLAAEAGMIPHELLTLLSPRYCRRYHGGGAA